MIIFFHISLMLVDITLKWQTSSLSCKTCHASHFVCLLLKIRPDNAQMTSWNFKLFEQLNPAKLFTYYHQMSNRNFASHFRLIVLILIRKSISSMKRHLEKMTDRLPYHFDDDMISNHSATSPNMHGKDTTMDTMVGHQSPDAEVVLWSLSFHHFVEDAYLISVYFLKKQSFSPWRRRFS